MQVLRKPDALNPLFSFSLIVGGNSIIIDDDIFFLCRTWRLRVVHCSSRKYVVRVLTVSGRRKHVKLHRLITNCPSGMHVHHRNCNPFDNRRCNLLVVSPKEHRLLHQYASY
jgi:hypothetical protein